MRSTHLPIQDGIQCDGHALGEPVDPKSEGEAFLTCSERPPASSKGYYIWLRALWPLFLHGILAIFIFTFTLVYVNHGNFNISDRRPTVRLHDGTITPWISSSPLQSDITTLLSVLIAILRLIAASWLGSLCWRCTFILLEEFGLKPEQLRWLVSYSITTVSPMKVAKGTRLTWWLIWVILVITIPVQLSAPILTGSITWVPGHHPLQRLSNLTIAIPAPDKGWYGSSTWIRRAEYTEKLLRLAASLNSLTWGREEQTTAVRRYLPGLQLEINSTLTNITVPYFSVQSIEWVNDPNNTLSAQQLSVDIRDMCLEIGLLRNDCPTMTGEGFFLLPDPPKPNGSQSNLTDPNPSVVSERRLMMRWVGHARKTSDNITRCLDSIGAEVKIDSIDVEKPFYFGVATCYVYAWITYVAGASTCYDCRVTSHQIVQNNSVLTVKEDFMTKMALRLSPVVTTLIEEQGLINAVPTWKDFDEQVTAMLTRAYAASWMAITDRLAWNNSFDTTYSLSPPASQASVDILRVYIWLGLQSLVTLSGVLFIYVQSRTGTPIIADTTLAAFYLDTSAVRGHDAVQEAYLAGRVELEGDRLKLKTE